MCIPVGPSRFTKARTGVRVCLNLRAALLLRAAFGVVGKGRSPIFLVYYRPNLKACRTPPQDNDPLEQSPEGTP